MTDVAPVSSSSFSRVVDSLPNLIDAASQKFRHRTAIEDSNEAWSFTELACATRRWAAWFRSIGVRRYERVVLITENSACLAAAILGVTRCGAAAVPLSPRTQTFQLSPILANVAPTLVLLDDDATASTVRDERYCIWSWSEASAEAPKMPLAEGPPPISTDPALLLHTSGTTAVPKGVVCQHRQVLAAATRIAVSLKYRASDTVFGYLPFSFDYGLYQILLCLIAGAKLVVGTNRDAGPRLVQRICQVRATVVPLVPVMASVLVAHLRRRNSDIDHLRLMTNTGDFLPLPLEYELRRRLPRSTLVRMFGLTECKRVSIFPLNEMADREEAIGRPLPGTEVQVLDEEGVPLPPGGVGQFVVRGPHVMSGYWRDPEATATRFVRSAETGEIALFTGDYGWKDERGYLFFEGRRDDVVKVRGTRVSIPELESGLIDIPGVTQAVVVRTDGGEEPHAFVVGNLSPATVIRELRERLDYLKVPTRCTVLSEMPLLSSGKADRAELRRRISSA